MSTPAIACANGPGSPACSASTAVCRCVSYVERLGDIAKHPARHDRSEHAVHEARAMLGTHGGKVAPDFAPAGNAVTASSARTSTIGRSRIVPNDVTTGVFSG